MKKNQMFLNFVSRLKENNPALIEAIESGFSVIMEAGDIGRTYDNQFSPRYVPEFLKEGEWEDTSWKNDVAPSFTSPSRGLRVWVDDDKQELRKGDGSKYTVYKVDELGNMSGDGIFDTDNEDDLRSFLTTPFTEGAIGKALATAGLALGLAAGHASAGDTKDIPAEAKNYSQQIKDQYLDNYDANNKAFQAAKTKYAELKATDPDKANQFAHIINVTLKPFSIFAPIGDTVTK